MFPTGRAGIALLCLRLSVAATLLTATSIISQPSIVKAVIILIAVALCLGLATPLGAALCFVGQIVVTIRGQGSMELCMAVASLFSLALALIGPGAYSLDARLFGRRRIVFSSTDDTKAD